MLGARRRGRSAAGDAKEAAEPNSLFGEILDWMLAPLLFIWPLSIAVTYHVANEIADAPYDQYLAESLRAVSRLVQVRDSRVAINFPAPARALLRADELDTIYYQVRGPAGEVVAGDRDVRRVAPDPGQTPHSVLFRDDHINGEEVRVAYQFLRTRGDREAPLALVQVAETKGKRRELANRIVSGVLLPQFAVIPLAVVLIYVGLGRGIAPLTRLQARIGRRRPSDLSALSTQGMPKEVLPLILAFNDMMARLEQNLVAQQRFIADAAHQMRTPLTGLKMQTDLALQEHEPQALHASLGRISESADRAAHLINQLLSLARAEASSEATHAVEVVDLEGIVAEVAGELVPLARAKSLDFGVELSGLAVLMEGNRLQLREMLKNLLDNAIKYTPPGGKVTARTVPTHFAAVEIEDNGPGISATDQELVFERFYRSSEQAVEGSGLGLAIVREIAHLHRGSVQLKVPAGGRGTLVVATFPRRRRPPPTAEESRGVFPLA